MVNRVAFRYGTLLTRASQMLLKNVINTYYLDANFTRVPFCMFVTHVHVLIVVVM